MARHPWPGRHGGWRRLKPSFLFQFTPLLLATRAALSPRPSVRHLLNRSPRIPCHAICTSYLSIYIRTSCDPKKQDSGPRGHLAFSAAHCESHQRGKQRSVSRSVAIAGLLVALHLPDWLHLRHLDFKAAARADSLWPTTWMPNSSPWRVTMPPTRRPRLPPTRR